MKDSFGSLKCPDCGYGLFTAAFCNLAFFNKSHCPYCGTSVRWAPLPFALLILGLVAAGTGAYLVINEITLPAGAEHAPALALGIGFSISLLSLFFIRFTRVNTASSKRPATRAKMLYPPIR
ncbi:MAG: hypothetical protein KDD69_02780 [Bdellovibrionales bacterium]|nr:hypothetical protein [Bdellovibrionales bacterium]